MTTTASSSILDTYDREGTVAFRNVLDPDLIAEASAHVDWLHQRYPDRTGEGLSHELITEDPFWVRLVSDDRLLDLAQLFIGPDIALFASHYISKPPRTGKAVLWHQDAAFWPLDPMQVVTLWLAVDDSTIGNGCLRVVPGSHKQSLLDMHDGTDVDNVLGAEIEAEVDESEARDLVLNSGDVEVHHPMLIHGSNANLSGQSSRVGTMASRTSSAVIMRRSGPASVPGKRPGRPDGKDLRRPPVCGRRSSRGVAASRGRTGPGTAGRRGRR